MNLIELIWLSIGVTIMILTGARLPKTIRDLRLSNTNWTEVKEFIRLELPFQKAKYSLGKINLIAYLAWGYVRRESLRFTSGTIITGIGIYAALTPETIHPTQVTISGLLITIGLLCLGFITATQSSLDRRAIAFTLKAAATQKGLDKDSETDSIEKNNKNQ